MKRREVYGTTGPRMIVRFFGGFDFEARDAQTRLPAKIGYTKGVPMGGDLSNAPKGKAPTFLAAALKDPIGANLDRYQIIKGWLDAKGAATRKDLRRRLVRKPQVGFENRQAALGGQYGGCRERDLDQHHRRNRADRGVERSGIRSGAARFLLRARDRDPDAALDRLRREIFRRQDAKGSADDHHRARLHFADLVYAGSLTWNPVL